MKTKKILAALLAFAATVTLGMSAMAVEEPADAPEIEAVMFEDPADGWYAEADTNWYNAEATTFEISEEEDLAGLAKLVNEGTDSFAGKTVNLTANIDLKQADWTSIGTSAKPFLGTFDGNGKTISNLFGAANANGLFGYTSSGNRADNYGSEAIIKNFTIDGAVITDNSQAHDGVGAVVGCGNMHTTIENVTVKGEVIIVGKRAGGILGYAYSGARINNCHVDGANKDSDSRINALLWACGGIMGFGGPDGDVGITNCSVKNVGINAVNHYGAGGILGNGGSGKVENVSVENVTCSVAYYPEAVYYISGGPSATGDVTVTNAIAKVNGEVVDVTGENLENVTVNVAKIGNVLYTSLKDAIKNAVKGDTIILLGVINEGDIKLPATIKNLTIDGQGTAIVKNTTINAADGGSVVYEGLTVKNTTFENSRFVLGGMRNGEVLYKDLVFDNNKFLNIENGASMAAIHMNVDKDEKIENFTFTNNTVDGVSGSNNSGVLLKAVTGTVLFENNKMSNIAWNAVQIATAKAELNLVVKNNEFQSNGSSVLNIAAAPKATLENNTIIPAAGKVGLWYPSEASIGNTLYPTLNAAVNAANEGDVIVLTQPTYEAPIAVTKSVVITGNPNYGETTTLTAATEKPVIVIKDTTNGGVEYHAPNVVFDNLVFKVAENATGAGWNVSALGYYYEIVADRNGLTVTNCDFINNSELAIGAIAANIGKYTIKNNTFKNFSTAVWSYVDHGALDTVVIDGNKFENVDNIANVYWGVENTAATIKVENNKSTDGSTAQISITDFGKTKTPSVTAIPRITVYGNDAETVLGNMDETNIYSVDTGLVHSYASEGVLRSMDGDLPDGVVYVQYGTDNEEMFIVENGYVKEEAQNVKLVFEENSYHADGKFSDELDNSVWDIYLVANEGGILHRLNSADFTFELTTDGKDAMAYEIIATNAEIKINNVNNDANRYEFHYDGKTGTITDTATKIKIGTVKFTGFGGYTFAVDTTEVAENTNQVHTTTFVDNIVDSFIVGGVVDAEGNVTNELYVNSTIDSTIIVPTKTLTINIDFPNSVENNAVAYQQMKVVVSGGELEAPLTIDLGTKSEISDFTSVTYDNKDDIKVTVTDLYTIKVENLLEINTAYNVEVSGAGYRTAKYTVTMTDNKTLNFWNNVKDNKVEVEEGKDTSAKNVTFLAGDIVKDSLINIYDLSAVVSYFGEIDLDEDNKPEYAKYDLNRDGKIDSKDVAYVLVSWNN